jgi:hypothetical protein
MDRVEVVMGRNDWNRELAEPLHKTQAPFGRLVRCTGELGNKPPQAGIAYALPMATGGRASTDHRSNLLTALMW